MLRVGGLRITWKMRILLGRLIPCGRLVSFVLLVGCLGRGGWHVLGLGGQATGEQPSSGRCGVGAGLDGPAVETEALAQAAQALSAAVVPRAGRLGDSAPRPSLVTRTVSSAPSWRSSTLTREASGACLSVLVRPSCTRR